MKIRARGEQIRSFIIENIEKYPHDIAKITSEKFSISRQAVNKHLQNLAEERILSMQGSTRSRKYTLCPLEQWNKSYQVDPTLAEDIVWRRDIAPSLEHLPGNILDIWHYGFTEMFNNAIDHSGSPRIFIELIKTASGTEMMLADEGIGIFKKIQNELNLLDESHAILELSKGKLTTDPENHTGEGIFFSSRMFDDFRILSGGIYFSHTHGKDEDWILERDKFSSGTAVFMCLHNHTSRTTKKVFDQFTSGDDVGFTKTIVPVRLAQYGDDKLISRSQAKRLLARVDRFKMVILDFEGVESIGQAFADEIFRVFQNRHPEVKLIPINTNSTVSQMIKRALLNA
jgi:anti-sigma regulatory factor (Ser/Thr protein kinase)